MLSSQQLAEFGLNDKEARVYLAALSLGPDSIQNVAKRANIHRVTTYDIAASLNQKGMIKEITQGKKRLFVAAEPEKILRDLNDKQRTIQSLLPELKALQSKAKPRPKIMYYEGRKAVWEAYQDRIRYKPESKENLVYGSSESLLKTYPLGFKKFTKERLQKGIRSRIIVERSKSGFKEAKDAARELREVKFLPQGIHFKANTIIYADRVMTISWESMLLVITEDQANAENQRILFKLLWEQMKGNDNDGKGTK